ncbi:MAG: cache domain-containing protein, partial [Burkholderiaceae bacterium]
MQLNWIHTIKFQIVALAVATGVLSTLATAELVLRNSHADIERLLMDNGVRNLEGTAALIANKLDMLTTLIVAVARHTAPQLWADRAALSAYLADKPATLVVFDTVSLFDASGQPVLRFDRGNPSTQLPYIGDRPYFAKAMASDQPVVSEPLIGRTSGVPQLVIAMATPPLDGQATGMIAGSLALRSSSLFASLGQNNAPDGSRTLVMSRAGQLLSHPNPARVLGNAADEPGLRTVYEQWRDSGSPIDTVGVASLSGGQLIVRAGIPGSDWILVQMTPAEVAMQPLHATQRAAWESAAVVGLIAALLAGVVAWWLTLPITRLRQRVHAELASDANTSLPWPTQRGELGSLVRAFQRLEGERVRRQTETQAWLQQLEAVLDHAQIGIALTRNSVFELVSRQFCETMGAQRSDLQGQPTRVLYDSDEAYAALSARAHPQFLAQGFFDGEVELMRKSGERFWAHMRGRAIAPGDLSQGTIWTFEDVTGEREHREKLTWSSSHDALTALTNRQAFDALLVEATTHAIESPFCALFI